MTLIGCKTFNFKIQSGAATCSEGFVTCFLRVQQAIWLYCSCDAAQERKDNFQKTYYKTFGTNCRKRLYISEHYLQCACRVEAGREEVLRRIAVDPVPLPDFNSVQGGPTGSYTEI